ncbi:hypothetical protein PO002_45820 [Cupriavidus necator]|uniref:hypothetical protein n=1 Tax=Cupriavidus necator TaxID=106590 RepID=UPI0039C1E9F3
MRNLAAEIVCLQQNLRALEDDLLVLEDISKVKALAEPIQVSGGGTPARRPAVLKRTAHHFVKYCQEAWLI